MPSSFCINFFIITKIKRFKILRSRNFTIQIYLKKKTEAYRSTSVMQKHKSLYNILIPGFHLELPIY